MGANRSASSRTLPQARRRLATHPSIPSLKREGRPGDTESAVDYSCPMTTRYTHDALVLGAGSAGLTAAGGLAMFGLNVALIERDRMGGECLNTGCVPSKALLAAAHHAQTIRDAARFGIHASDPTTDFAAVRAHIRHAIETLEPEDSVERFEGMGVDVVRGDATLVDARRLRVVDSNGAGRELSAPRLVLATGSDPAVPPIDGLADGPFLTNETLWDLDALPEHLLILGAGNIGCEMGQAFRRLGSEVTVVDTGRPLSRDDAEAAAIVQATLEGEGVRFVTGQAASVSHGGGVTLTLEGGKALTGSHLLVAAGRRARVEGFGLENTGVTLGDNGIVVDARRRTNVPGVYAVGDCREGPRLTHAAGRDGSAVAVEIGLGVPSPVDDDVLPWVTFTSPELAQVGLTEAAARERGWDVTVERQDFAHNDRAVTEGRTAGFLKVVRRGRSVVGATIVGGGAGEMLLPWSQIIAGKASPFALASSVVAYPTRSEMSKAAAFAMNEKLVFGAVPKWWAGRLARWRR